MPGLIHIYCGDGKGKTTAAAGLTVRAVGAGKKVVFAQFLKNGASSEIQVLCELDGVDVCVCRKNYGFVNAMNEETLKEAQCDYSQLLCEALQKARDGADILVLDEVISACNHRLISEQQLVEFLHKKPEDLEVVLTGRSPSADLLSGADYITEMKKIRHPYDNGIKARAGIEL